MEITFIDEQSRVGHTTTVPRDADLDHLKKSARDLFGFHLEDSKCKPGYGLKVLYPEGGIDVGSFEQGSQPMSPTSASSVASSGKPKGAGSVEKQRSQKKHKHVAHLHEIKVNAAASAKTENSRGTAAPAKSLPSSSVGGGGGDGAFGWDSAKFHWVKGAPARRDKSLEFFTSEAAAMVASGVHYHRNNNSSNIGVKPVAPGPQWQPEPLRVLGAARRLANIVGGCRRLFPSFIRFRCRDFYHTLLFLFLMF